MAHTTKTARCRLSAFGEAVLAFPFRAALVDDLKAGVPYRYRDYNPTTMEWTVQPEYADFATALLLEHFPDADVPARARWRQAQPDSCHAGADHLRVLCLRDSAPPGLIDAAYRWWARELHPDRGGSHEQMVAVNHAYAALREQVGA
jgi:hypothetical protein